VRVIETKVYLFAELSDRAKDVARDWYREGEMMDFSDTVETEDFETICTILGITLKTRSVPLMSGKTRQEPCIWYNVGGHQGDGACFEGTYSYGVQSSRLIRKHAPEDKELHRIADTLAEVQRTYQYLLSATVTAGRETYSRCTHIDVQHETRGYVDEDIAEPVAGALRDLMDWYYKYLQAEYDYRMSDDAVDESIEANEYEFTEDGKRA
jgi:hypothetical protein